MVADEARDGKRRLQIMVLIGTPRPYSETSAETRLACAAFRTPGDSKPGEGIQLDVKYVYPNGQRAYQFTVLDPFTERCYAEVFPTRESKNAALAIERAAMYFGFPILSVQTDNGSEFHGWCEMRGIPHYFIPKRSPYWNGKVERVHRTMDEEFYLNPRREWKTLPDWLHWYNEERLRLTLNGATPKEKANQALSTVTP